MPFAWLERLACAALITDAIHRGQGSATQPCNGLQRIPPTVCKPMRLGIPRPQNEMPLVKLPVMLCALCRPPDYADVHMETGFGRR